MPLGSKAFEVLTCLVMRAGEVVTKDELLKTVWPESFVEESNLSQHLSSLRAVQVARQSVWLISSHFLEEGTGLFTERYGHFADLPPCSAADAGSFLLWRTGNGPAS